MNTRFYLREQSKGTYIMVDVTGNGLPRFRTSTGIMTTEKDWDNSKSRIKGSDMQTHLDNKKLSDIENKVTDLPIDYAKGGLTAEVVKLELQKVIAPHRVKTEEAAALGRWAKLSLYATDGKLEIDNNLVENVIRPVALGRKNYLFAGSHEAAQRSAMLYSFMGTCKLRGVEPLQWLKTTLSKLPDHKANKLIELLPS